MSEPPSDFSPASQPLAILGGPPRFSTPLHVGRPNVGDRERILSRIADMLDRRWLSNGGPYVCEFEQLVAQILGVKFCVATCNGTLALHLAVRALEMTGEVILPAFTFVATAHALQWQGVTPVFCDVDPFTGTVDPAAVEKKISPRTTGIIGVHLWGRGCEVDALQAIASRHGLRLLYDAAHAFGCTKNGVLIGNFGDAEVLSFHATKFVNCFEGGAIVTNNAELAKKLQIMRNFGFGGEDQVDMLGINAKMSEASAAMGLTSLESMQRFIQHNLENYLTYCRGTANIPGLRVMRYDAEERCNYQYVVLDIDERISPLSRDELHAVLRAEGVLARRYFYPGVHQMEPYRTLFPNAGLVLPGTNLLSRRLLSLPTGTTVTQQDAQQVCELIRLALSQAAAIRMKLSPITAQTVA